MTLKEPAKCNFTLKRRDPERPERSAWCSVHDQWSEECAGDPIDATLGHIVADAERAPKLCPHCKKELE